MKLNDPSVLLPELPQGAEILIARLRSLGDVVLETPAISALHAWRPDLRIVVLVEKRFAPALEGNPAVADRIFSRGFVETAAELRQRKFPVFYNQHGGPRSALLTAVSGAVARVGWKGFQYSSVYNVRVPDATEFYGTSIVHAVAHRMSQFYWTGLPRGPIPEARVLPQPQATERVRMILAQYGVAGVEAPYAVLQPGGRLATMRWPIEKFAEIARWLQARHGTMGVVNLASSDGPIAVGVRRAMEGIAIVPEPFDLPELIALISGASLFVGNDSGPVHLASALGTPCVVIYGTTNPAQWRPWQVAHRVVSTGAEFRALRGDKTVAVSEPRLIGAIEVEEVEKACEELFGAVGTRGRAADQEARESRARSQRL